MKETIVIYLTTLLIANASAGFVIDNIEVIIDGHPVIHNLYSPNANDAIVVEAKSGQVIQIDFTVRTSTSGKLVMKSDLVDLLIYKGAFLVSHDQQPVTVNIEPGLTSLEMIGTVPDNFDTAILVRVLDANTLNQLLDIKLRDTTSVTTNDNQSNQQGTITNNGNQSSDALTKRVETLKQEVAASTLPDSRKMAFVEKLKFITSFDISVETKLKMLEEVENSFKNENAESSSAWRAIVNSEALLGTEGDESKKNNAEKIVTKAKDEFARGEYGTAQDLAEHAAKLLTHTSLVDVLSEKLYAILPFSVLGIIVAVALKGRKKREEPKTSTTDVQPKGGGTIGYF